MKAENPRKLERVRQKTKITLGGDLGIAVGLARDDELLGGVLVDELPLTNVILALAFTTLRRDPDPAPLDLLLALGMLVRTVPVGARVEFAHDRIVPEFAAGNGAIRTVTARRHRRVLVGTILVGAVGEVDALGRLLVRTTFSGRRVSAGTFPVLASNAVTACIRHVHRLSVGGSWTLVGEGAIDLAATQIELAHDTKRVSSTVDIHAISSLSSPTVGHCLILVFLL